MYKLPDTTLSAQSSAKLASLQREIDELSRYDEQVERADRMWRNRTDNREFRQIRDTLAGMSWGNMRCGYCEDNTANEIEHIKPKSLYPEETFVWSNYLYSCGPCNNGKSNRFAVFAEPSGELTWVKKSDGDPVPGEPVLVNPRVDRAEDFFELDLEDTFQFVPLGEPPSAYVDNSPSRTWLRADNTIWELFHLNREPLPAQRRNAFGNYRSRLQEYIKERDGGTGAGVLARHIEEIQSLGHPFVWSEMKRQRDEHPVLLQLFTEAPEALGWEPLSWSELLERRIRASR